MALTVKQEKFCQAYVETGNASEAYRSAYSADKMKAATVNSKAYELLNNGEITV
ncbi:terminase small subunit, partial [Morganella morganii]